MHYIQSKILDKLTYAENLKYSQLRPRGIESNHFAYHLKQLQKSGFIVKVESLYTLSAKGKSHVDRVSHRTLTVRTQPKIITLLDVKNSKGQNIIYRRKHQPYIGLLGYPSGKLHVGENIESAAKREIVEKLHFEDFEIKHRGMIYITIYENGEFISTVLAHIFSGVTDQEIKADDAHRVTRFWGKFEDYNEKEIIPGFKEIEHGLKSKTLFFNEVTYELNY